jgi:GTP-binding protein YchF
MALALYLIGAPQCGKTAVFDALTITPAGPNFMTKGGHRYGTVKVPDARLEALRDLFKPKKFTPAEVTFTDVAPPGGEAIHFGDMTPVLGNADAFVLVVQAFGEFDYEGKPLDPVAQMESILLSITVTDFERIEKRIEKAETDKKHGGKMSDQELKLLERCRDHLGADKPLRTLELRDDEEKILRTYQFLSQKPLLVVANISEDRIRSGGLDALAAAVKGRGLDLLQFCATLEAEIATLDAAAQVEFLKDYGLTEPARIRLLRAAYTALRLIGFFTVGEDEVRAWTIHEGTSAQAAAGKIHTDIERGFIRAETVSSDELLKAGALSKCRDHGTLRLEGKEYIVRDGEVLHFRFSV